MEQTEKQKKIGLILEQISSDLNLMATKEPEALEAIAEIISHVAKTYGDKYQSPVTEIVNTKALLLSENGKQANIHCALKYLQRYLTTGFEKSNNAIDLKKSVHYILFELQRRQKYQ